jgi:hypothetical protein
MADLNLLEINVIDPQDQLVEKLNYNFSQIINIGGGPQGPPGRIGGTGPIGPIGRIGKQGNPGQRGAKWYVSSTAPSSSDILPGDYWLQATSSSSSNPIYQFNLNITNGLYTWIATGLSLNPSNIFQMSNVSTSSSYNSLPSINTKAAIFNNTSPNPDPKFSSFVSSDTDYTTITNGDRMINPNGAKVKITTGTYGITGASRPLLEFSRGDLESTTDITEKSLHPKFYFTNGGLGGNPGYDVTFAVPQSTYTVSAGGYKYNNSGLTGPASGDQVYPLYIGSTSGLVSNLTVLEYSGDFVVNPGATSYTLTQHYNTTGKAFSIATGGYVGTYVISPSSPFPVDSKVSVYCQQSGPDDEFTPINLIANGSYNQVTIATQKPDGSGFFNTLASGFITIKIKL